MFIAPGDLTDSMSSTDLSAAVDVYGEWVDAAGKQLIDHIHVMSAPPTLTNRSRCTDAVAKADTAEGSYEGTAKTFNATKRNQSGRGTHGDDEDDAHYEGEGIAADDEEY